MSYKYTVTKAFYADEFDITPKFGYQAPYICDLHIDPSTNRPLCFVASSVIGQLATDGWATLRQKLDIANLLPGTKRRLTVFSSKGLIEIGWGTVIVAQMSDLTLRGDGADIWKSPLLGHNNGSWLTNTFALNLPIDTYSELDVVLWQVASVLIGGITVHDAELILQGEYYLDVPPPTANVTIIVENRETGGLISKARVKLLSGTQVVADKYTDGGEVTFLNIDEGSYMLSIGVSGYESFESMIEVVAPAVEYTARLTPIPVSPLPWWVIPAVVGTIAIGGISVFSGLVKKPSPPVYVVK